MTTSTAVIVYYYKGDDAALEKYRRRFFTSLTVVDTDSHKVPNGMTMRYKDYADTWLIARSVCSVIEADYICFVSENFLELSIEKVLWLCTVMDRRKNDITYLMPARTDHGFYNPHLVQRPPESRINSIGENITELAIESSGGPDSVDYGIVVMNAEKIVSESPARYRVWVTDDLALTKVQ